MQSVKTRAPRSRTTHHSDQPSVGAPDTRLQVPEDVRAELDAEQRRARAEGALAAPAEAIPDDVLSELDREARIGNEEELLMLAEGEPPLDEEV
jgi:hypothetical protein